MLQAFRPCPLRTLAAAAALALAPAAAWADEGFSIDLPDGWALQGDPRRGGAHAGPAAPYGISVQHGPAPPGAKMGAALVDSLVEGEIDACRANAAGPCWSFRLVSASQARTGGLPAADISYEMVLDDADVSGRILYVLDGADAWRVSGLAADPSDGALGAVGSFRPGGGGPAAPPPGAYRPPPGHPPAGEAELEARIDVSLILVGREWTQAEMREVLSRLPAHVEPTTDVNGTDASGLRYVLAYGFSSASPEDSRWLEDVLLENSEEAPLWGVEEEVPWQTHWVSRELPWLLEFEGDEISGTSVPYRQVDALAAEEFIYTSIVASEPYREGPRHASLVFLASDHEDAGYLRNYALRSEDKASGRDFDYVGLMGYGGRYNMHFFDLYAVPWPEWGRYGPSYPEWTRTLHGCHGCLADLAAYHAGAAVRHVVAPSFVYPPEYDERYLLDVVLYPVPGSGSLLNDATAGRYVSAEAIAEEVGRLYPHSEWEVDVSLERQGGDGIPYEFKQALASTGHEVHEYPWGEESANLLRSEDLQPHLVWWAENRTRDSPPPEGTRHVPALVAIYSGPNDLYVDDVGTVGTASALLDDPSRACCAFAVGDEEHVWSEGVGLTDLVLHEVGHALGLPHPFQGDGLGMDSDNRYFEWYSSPMTYSMVPDGCGILYLAWAEGPCGNAGLRFTEFEVQRTADMRLLDALREAERLLAGAAPGPERSRGEALAAEARELFSEGSVLGAGGAMEAALAARAIALEHGAEPPAGGPAGAPGPGAADVPVWVKESARAWASGGISDAGFAGAVRHMVDAGMMDAEAPARGPSPGWVKELAGWWAAGDVSDAEFAAAAGHLLRAGLLPS